MNSPQLDLTIPDPDRRTATVPFCDLGQACRELMADGFIVMETSYDWRRCTVTVRAAHKRLFHPRALPCPSPLTIAPP